ncbi:MAG: TorD/DmsD family molecular chaperone [Candidatus Rokuibacteriota bacterium]
MIGDRELRDFRADHYGLFVSLLWREPSGELLEALGRGIDVRVTAAQGLHPQLASGWREIAGFLVRVPAAEVAATVGDEYTRLFVGPYGVEIYPYESYYLTGRVFDRPLAELRAFLATIGIARQEGLSEPEDWLAFELDVMRRLVQRQAEAGGVEAETRVLDQQAAFLKRHLLVWAPSAAREVAEAKGAVFYRGVGHLLAGFLALEQEFFESRGQEPLVSVEDARRQYAGSDWQGPLFDLPTPPGVEPEETGDPGQEDRFRA